MAVMGEGDGCIGVSVSNGGKENSFWRDAVPSRRLGRFNSEAPSLANVGPASSPSSRFTSSKPSRSTTSSSFKSFPDAGVSCISWLFSPIEEKKRASGCFAEVEIGFSRRVAETVRHRSGSVKFNLRKAC